MAIAELQQISKTYPLGKTSVHALKNVSIEVSAGDFVAVAGPSGSGKTTIMNLIGLIDSATSGEVLIEGRKTSGLGRRELTRLRHETLGFIFQSFNLLPVLNVAENVELPLLIGKTREPRKERKEWIEYLLEEVGLSDRMNHRPSELSGGQQQRVAIARALVTRPRIVVADEPTANLDSKTGKMILNLMKKINHEQKTTFVFSTHDPVIREIADHVIFLHDGRVESEKKRNGGAVD